MVGGLGLRPDGDLIVVDDPALLDPAEPLGTGRMFVAGQPAAHATGAQVHQGPPTASSPSRGDGVSDRRRSCECRVTGNGVDTGWDDCAGDGTFTVGPELADGSYVLSVRAMDGDVTGRPEAFRFTVDNVAPLAPAVAKPADGGAELTKVGTNPWFEFKTEDGAKLECKLDDAAESLRARPVAASARSPRASTRSSSAPPTPPATSPRRPPASFMVDATVLPGGPAPWGPGPADPQGLVARYADGLHISTGSIVDPNGRVWVSDHNGGFCRVTEPDARTAPARSTTRRCPGGPGPRTCLGGLLPEAGIGPDAAGQPVAGRPDPGQRRQRRRDRAHPGRRPPQLGRRPRQVEPGQRACSSSMDIVTMTGDGGARVRAPDGDGCRRRTATSTSSSRTRAPSQRIANAGGDEPHAWRSSARRPTAAAPEAVAAGRDADGSTRVFIAEDGGITSLEPNAVEPAADGGPGRRSRRRAARSAP